MSQMYGLLYYDRNITHWEKVKKATLLTVKAHSIGENSSGVHLFDKLGNYSDQKSQDTFQFLRYCR